MLIWIISYYHVEKTCAASYLAQIVMHFIFSGFFDEQKSSRFLFLFELEILCNIIYKHRYCQFWSI